MNPFARKPVIIQDYSASFLLADLGSAPDGDILLLSAVHQQAHGLSYLLGGTQCPLQINFHEVETHNEVLSKNGTSSRSVCPYFFIVKVSLFRIRAAALCKNQSAVVRFFRICNILQRCKLIN